MKHIKPLGIRLPAYAKADTADDKFSFLSLEEWTDIGAWIRLVQLQSK
jgi:hypothetical protein